MLSRIRRSGQDLDSRVIPTLVGIVILVALLYVLSRGAGSVDTEVIQLTIDAAATQTNAPIPALVAVLTTTPQDSALTQAAPTLSLGGRMAIDQFAASAEADSQLELLDWGSVQAAGPPNTLECGDFPTAWAPATTTAKLTLYFPELVRPSGLFVYQSFNPGYITLITFKDIYGEEHTLYQAAPQATAACPGTLVVSVEGADYPGNTVIIYIDATTSAGGRTEIDAVELFGIRY
jgi:hypothetical protein